MKYLYLLPLGIALLTVSCKSTNDKTAKNNPYQNNPYYGPSGSTYGSKKDYSSTASSTSYPSYSDSTYTPPSTTSPSPTLPDVPTVPSYDKPVPTYSSSSPSTYTTPYSSGSGSSNHTVAPGENLYRISLKHGTSVAAIKSANGLGSDTIHPGQVLKIP